MKPLLKLGDQSQWTQILCTPNSGEETIKICTQYLSVMSITSFWRRVILIFVACFKTVFSVLSSKTYQGHYGQKCPHTTHTKLYGIVSKYSSSVNWVIYYIINLNCSCTAGIHQIGHRCVTYITASSYFRNLSISFELSWAKWVDSSRILWRKTAVKTKTAHNSACYFHR